MQGSDGNFYGMTSNGGTNSYGTIFKMAPTGTLTVLKHLDGTNTGSYPYGSLVQGNDGAFYGMTYNGGTNSYGAIFKITSTGTFTLLKNLDYNTTGGYTFNSMIKGTDGNFYGMTSSGGANGGGTIFKMTSSGTITILKNLDDATTGGYGYAGLVQGSDGLLYGMVTNGGINGGGTIFKMNTAGTSFTVLKSLDNTTSATSSGSGPFGSLVQGTDGAFYGMTSNGGSPNNVGTAFKIISTGTFTVLLRFPDGNKGLYPQESLIQAADGNFYGTASQGGSMAQVRPINCVLAGHLLCSALLIILQMAIALMVV